MTEDPPLARRLTRPSWRDPRLGAGILLVAGSVALGTWAVRDASATEQLYVARDTLLPGTAVTEEHLQVVEARQPAPGGAYVDAVRGLPPGAVTTRVVGAGEMLPSAALGVATEVDLRPIVVPVGAALPSHLGPGAVVDLWFTPDPAATDPVLTPPELLAGGLLLAGVVDQESVFAGAGTAVELLVPTSQVAVVLEALARDGELVVVPLPGGQSDPGEDG